MGHGHVSRAVDLGDIGPHVEADHDGGTATVGLERRDLEAGDAGAEGTDLAGRLLLDVVTGDARERGERVRGEQGVRRRYRDPVIWSRSDYDIGPPWYAVGGSMPICSCRRCAALRMTARTCASSGFADAGLTWARRAG